MPDLKEAVNQIKRYAPMMQAVLDIAEAVDGLKNIDQAVAEKQGLLTKLTGEHEKVKAAVDAAKVKAREIVAKAEADAAAEAKRAQAGIDEAIAKAGQIIADAQAQAGEAKGAAKKAVDTAIARETEINAAIEAKQAELTALESKIADAQAKVARILGGVA